MFRKLKNLIFAKRSEEKEIRIDGLLSDEYIEKVEKEIEEEWKALKYRKGQKVRIKRNLFHHPDAESWNPPYVVTIDCIVPDPHAGGFLYLCKGLADGLREYEIEGLYIRNEDINRFELLDF